MSAGQLEEAIHRLDGAGASVRCRELAGLLEGLGFTVRDGKNGGHKVFVHAGLADFRSGSYNCDHGRDPEIKRPYIKNVLRILRQYEAELSRYLENEDD
ncbi:MAG: type II toxin-antitoxin system HicA family toxin [Rhodanobacter sp.]|nr:MAG: type II toxin-antitoxin system HicA family toxin [Rhodanobacter sp.]TAM09922.1 MAG: type II toxin-antitoxin system HicA family toxin [Rhodanobacter sp.]TAM34260.1 MAG: type II toxin-antitoxin system HicA family toxin [Rhodanobacter sp.]